MINQIINNMINKYELSNRINNFKKSRGGKSDIGNMINFIKISI